MKKILFLFILTGCSNEITAPVKSNVIHKDCSVRYNLPPDSIHGVINSIGYITVYYPDTNKICKLHESTKG